jgi:hypothetical protein
MNNNPYRGSKDYFNKIITIIPIQIEKFKICDLMKIIDVFLEHDIKPARIFDYFIYPRFEKNAATMQFENYNKMLNVLTELKYEVIIFIILILIII